MKKRIAFTLVFIAALLFSFLPLPQFGPGVARASGTSWLSGWETGYRVPATVDSSVIDAALTWFPITIILDSSAGKTNADVTAIFDEIGASYLKLAVTQDDGTTELYVQVYKWDTVEKIGILNVSKTGWVLDGDADSNLYIYFDSTHADNTAYVRYRPITPGYNVWDSDTKAVYHMDETVDPAYDSTSNYVMNCGSQSGGVTYGVTGKVGKATDYAGVDEYLVGNNTGTGTSLQLTDHMTISMWIEPDVVNISEVFVCKGDMSDSNPVNYRLSLSSGKIYMIVRKDGTNSVGRVGNTSIVQDAWTYVVGVFDHAGTGAARITIYINGVAESSYSAESSVGTLASYTDTSVLEIGRQNASGDYRYYNGAIDEIIISHSVRSAAWIKASYNSDKDSLLTYGTAQHYVAYVSTLDATSIDDESATLNGNITYIDIIGDITTRGFVYGFSQTATWDTHEHSTYSTGDYSLTINDLYQGQSYWFRAYISDGIFTSYGAWLRFYTIGTSLGGWNYSKVVTVSAGAGAGGNYTVKLLVGETASAAGEDFDLGNHTVDIDWSDGIDDLLFWCPDHLVVLPHWVESVTGAGDAELATVWVTVDDDLSTESQDIWVVYGRTGTESTSDGYSTFPFFDEFSGEPNALGESDAGKGQTLITPDWGTYLPILGVTDGSGNTIVNVMYDSTHWNPPFVALTNDRDTYYGTGKIVTGLETSYDGINWTEYGVVFDNGDTYCAGGRAAWMGSQFAMIYTGPTGDMGESIGIAVTSQANGYDLTNWTDLGFVLEPGVSPAPGNSTRLFPAGIKLINGHVYIFANEFYNEANPWEDGLGLYKVAQDQIGNSSAYSRIGTVIDMGSLETDWDYFLSTFNVVYSDYDQKWIIYYGGSTNRSSNDPPEDIGIAYSPTDNIEDVPYAKYASNPVITSGFFGVEEVRTPVIFYNPVVDNYWMTFRERDPLDTTWVAEMAFLGWDNHWEATSVTANDEVRVDIINGILDVKQNKNLSESVGIKSPSSYGPYNYAFRGLVKYTDDGVRIQNWGASDNNLYGNDGVYVQGNFFGNTTEYTAKNGGTTTVIGEAKETTSYHVDEIRWLNGNVTFYRDGASKGTITSNVANEDLNLRLSVYDASTSYTYIYADWVLVRKFVAIEPTFASASAEGPAFYNISTTPSSWDAGVVWAGTTYWPTGPEPSPWPLEDADCWGNVTNNSSFPVNVLISMSPMTGDITWNISTTPGTNIFVCKAGVSGTANVGNFTTLSETPVTFIASMPAGNVTKWTFVFYPPTNYPSTTDDSEHSGVITLAVEVP
jgi:hypothetical protein